MLVVKKINNNVAICLDSTGRELIAIGKGIGFPKTPYELSDLSQIERTFYDINSEYCALISEIPNEAIRFTADCLDQVRNSLPHLLNPNIVISLADHIAFTIERSKKGVYIQMPPIHEMEHSYPAEVKAGRYVYSKIQKHFRVRLPQDEIQGIAMHFINARMEDQIVVPEDAMQRQFPEILEQTTRIIEEELRLTIRRDTFSYARFASHLHYLCQRIFTQQYDTGSLQAYKTMREEFPRVAVCVDKIGEFYERKWSARLTEEEKMYLIMHTSRICVKEGL